VVIGQVKTSEKSNEITAIPELLKLLDIRGCLVTIDAMIAKAIVGKGADYLLAVKGNQKRLEKAFNDYFRMEMLQNFEGSSYSTQEEGHGRKETCVALINEDLSVLGDIAYDWPELKVMGIVASIRQVGDIPAEDISIRYYISSKKLDAKTLLESSRSHWSIEIQLHWKLEIGCRHE
jgi:predicted transposase YbfD/YdcC